MCLVKQPVIDTLGGVALYCVDAFDDLYEPLVYKKTHSTMRMLSDVSVVSCELNFHHIFIASII